MSSTTKELFHPTPMGVNASATVGGGNIGGFLAVTSGTLTVTSQNGTVLINAVPVTAGFYTPIPMQFHSSAGGVVQLGGGASGTLFT